VLLSVSTNNKGIHTRSVKRNNMSPGEANLILHNHLCYINVETCFIAASIQRSESCKYNTRCSESILP
jgi:hypothetical protein